MKNWILLLVAVAAMSPLQRVHAHSLGQSYVFVQILDRSVEGRVEITLEDLNKALGLDLKTDGTLTQAELDVHGAEIERYVRERLALAPDGNPGVLRTSPPDLFRIEIAQYAVIRFGVDALERSPRYIGVDYDVLFDVDPDHRGLLLIERDWGTGTFDNGSVVSLVFEPSASSQQLDLSSSSALGGFYGMIRLGVHHIWVGIDHVLFLMALLLPSVYLRRDGRWQPRDSFRSSLWYVVKIVTVFTIAHTITLSLAALETVVAPPRLVESVIAISIAIAAADIVYPVFRSRIWLVVFVFGLFHGFGFASVLTTMNIPSRYMALSLFGFNLGVEIGQIVIVSLVFPLLFLIRNLNLYARFGLQTGALGLIAISLYWFIERAFAVDLPAGEIVQRLLGIMA